MAKTLPALNEYVLVAVTENSEVLIRSFWSTSLDTASTILKEWLSTRWPEFAGHGNPSWNVQECKPGGPSIHITRHVLPLDC